MHFTDGDWIALATVALAFATFTVRELRANSAKTALAAVTETNISVLVSAITKKLDEVVGQLSDLEQKRQKHELDCAVIQERASNNWKRAVEIMDEHGRAIAQLQGQIRHVATGSADKVMEYPATRPE